MPGTIVQASNLDSVRIEVLGEGRAVTIPASMLLALDDVLGRLTREGGDLVVFERPHPQTPWRAILRTESLDRTDDVHGDGGTAWAALVDLAGKLPATRRAG